MKTITLKKEPLYWELEEMKQDVLKGKSEIIIDNSKQYTHIFLGKSNCIESKAIVFRTKQGKNYWVNLANCEWILGDKENAKSKIYQT